MQYENAWAADPEGLRDLAFRLLGKFASIQEFSETLAVWHVRKTSPRIADVIEGSVLGRMRDEDRIDWFRAVIEDCGIADLPVDAIVGTVGQAKPIRDHIAHSPGVNPLFTKDGWELGVQWFAKADKRAKKVPRLTQSVLQGHGDRLDWVLDWIVWIANQAGYAKTRNLRGESITPPRPSDNPPAFPKPEFTV